MGKVKPRKSRIPLDRKEVKEIIEGKEINVNVVPDPKLAQPMPVKVVIPENQPVVAKNYPVNQYGRIIFEVTRLIPD